MDAEFNSASNEYPHCILLTDLATPKTRKDKNIIIMFFQVFLVFGVAGSVKSMQCGYSLDVEQNSASNELSCLKFEYKNTGRYVENTNKKIVFFYYKYVNSTIMVDSFY